MTPIADSAENRDACLCTECPSKPPDDWAGVYCGRGQSPVDTQTTGCRCPDCDVYEANELREGYFCAVEPELWTRFREHSQTQAERERAKRS